MIVLTKSQIIALHELLTQQTGGHAGLRDAGMLDAALHAPFLEVFGVKRYPTVIEKSAALGYFLASDHPFIDGNKRIALLAMLTTLRLNGISLCVPTDRLITFGLDLAQNKLSVSQITDFIRQYKSEVNKP